MLKDYLGNEIKNNLNIIFHAKNGFVKGEILDIFIEKNKPINEFGLSTILRESIIKDLDKYSNYNIPNPKLYIGYDKCFDEYTQKFYYQNFCILSPTEVIINN